MRNGGEGATLRTCWARAGCGGVQQRIGRCRLRFEIDMHSGRSHGVARVGRCSPLRCLAVSDSTFHSRSATKAVGKRRRRASTSPCSQLDHHPPTSASNRPAPIFQSSVPFIARGEQSLLTAPEEAIRCEMAYRQSGTAPTGGIASLRS